MNFATWEDKHCLLWKLSRDRWILIKSVRRIIESADVSEIKWLCLTHSGRDKPQPCSKWPNRWQAITCACCRVVYWPTYVIYMITGLLMYIIFQLFAHPCTKENIINLLLTICEGNSPTTVRFGNAFIFLSGCHCFAVSNNFILTAWSHEDIPSHKSRSSN